MNLQLNYMQFIKHLDITSLKSDASLSFRGSEFIDLFKGPHLELSDDLYLDGATFQTVELLDASIGGSVELDGSTFWGDLNADRMEIGANLGSPDVKVGRGHSRRQPRVKPTPGA